MRDGIVNGTSGLSRSTFAACVGVVCGDPGIGGTHVASEREI